MAYPADTYAESVELTITASNQLHTILNGDSTTEVAVEDGSKIPSVRKAMVDSLYFKPPIAWAQGAYEDTYNQLREFVDGDVRTWWFAKGATVSTPVLMSTNPATDVNWTLWSAVTLNAATYETQKHLAAEAGLNMVGSFLLGATVTTTIDVVFYESDGKYYSWGGALPKVVAAGATPATSGGIGAGAWSDKTDLMLRSELIANGVSISELSNIKSTEGAGTVGFDISDTYEQKTVGDKLQRVCNIDDFNDYYLVSSDWGPAFTAAFSYLNAKGSGGVVKLADGKRYPVESSFNVPSFCRIEGNGFAAASQSNLTNLLATIPGIVLNTSATITLYGSASLKDVAILRKGLVGFENGTSAFVGTAIKTAEGYDDQTLKEVVVLGFERGIDAKSSQRVTITDAKMDCLNCVRISNSRDISRFTRIHCWPYITVGGTGDDILYRDGVGIEASGVDSVDWLTINDSFTFGYRIGLYLQNCMLPTINNFAADSYTGLSAGLRAGMSGIFIDDYVTEPTIIAPKLTGLQQNGILIDMHGGNTSEVCISNGVFKELVAAVHLVNGLVSLSGNRYSSLTYAYSVDNATSRIKGRSEHYDSTVTTPCYLNSDTTFVSIDESCTAESAFGASFFCGPGKPISFISGETSITSAYNLQNFSNYQELYSTTAKTISSINDKGQPSRTVVFRNAGTANITFSGAGIVGSKTVSPNSAVTLTRISSTQWLVIQ